MAGGAALKAGKAAVKVAREGAEATTTKFGELPGVSDSFFSWMNRGARKALTDLNQMPDQASTTVLMDPTEYFDFTGAAPRVPNKVQIDVIDQQIRQGRIKEIPEITVRKSEDGSTLEFVSRDDSVDISMFDYLRHTKFRGPRHMPVVIRMEDGTPFDEAFEVPLYRQSKTQERHGMFSTPALQGNKVYAAPIEDASEAWRMPDVVYSQTAETSHDNFRLLHTVEHNALVAQSKASTLGDPGSGIPSAQKYTSSMTAELKPQFVKGTDEAFTLALDGNMRRVEFFKKNKELYARMQEFTKDSLMQADLIGGRKGEPIIGVRVDRDLVVDPETGRPGSYSLPREVGVHIGYDNTGTRWRPDAGALQAKQDRLTDNISGLMQVMDADKITQDELVEEIQEIVNFSTSSRTLGTEIQLLFNENQFFDDMLQLLERYGADDIPPDFDTFIDEMMQEIKNLVVGKGESMRAQERSKLMDVLESTYVMNVQRPFILQDTGGFSPAAVALQLEEMPGMSKKYGPILDEIVALGNAGNRESDEYIEATKGIQKILEREGYDSIGYVNHIEPGGGAGLPSYILWREDSYMILGEEMLSEAALSKNMLGSFLFAALGIGAAGDNKETSNGRTAL